MKNNKILFLFFGFIVCTNTFAENNNWNDLNQDSIQVRSPVEFIDTYNKYTVVGENKK